MPTISTMPTPIAEGKTKRIFPIADDVKSVLIVSKDDITAGDGAKHDVLTGKAAFATRTTCNAFRMLKSCGIPVAFDEQVDGVSFRAPLCKMLPYEVVVRREAHGSYIKRMPGLAKGHYFPKLVLEFFLKTSGKKWKGHDLPCDDPLISFVWDAHGEVIDSVQLFGPAKPIATQEPFLVFGADDVFARRGESALIKKMGTIAKRTFLVLEKCWQLLGRTLVDFKVEFGIDPAGDLLLADVIDNDSWRVLENGAYIDKQVYRDGGELDEVLRKYAQVAALTDRFESPSQRIVVWAGSEEDNVGSILEAIAAILGEEAHGDAMPLFVGSIHRKPTQSIAQLNQLIQEMPDCVIIACIGATSSSELALSAATTVPVINVVMDWEFPEDVWLSLRTPSGTPALTVLRPENAALAALNILSARNPHLYMLIRERVEERLVNTMPL